MIADPALRCLGWIEHPTPYDDKANAREEVVEEYGEALITLTHQGVRCLQVAEVLFADIDFPANGENSVFLARARSRLEAFSAERYWWSLRLYRTHGGLRAMATHALFDPRASEVVECFEALAVDVLYSKMVEKGCCFRARLSAKPHRIGIAPSDGPPSREWLSRYYRAAAPYATCRYLETFGTGFIHPRVAPVMELHDEHCRAHTALPLA